MPLNVANPSTTSTSHVPKSYAEVFSHYYPAILGLMKKFHIDPRRREDVAMTILTKFIEKDVLSDFDPEYVGRNGQPIRFQTFLSSFVISYVRYFREREILMAAREMTLIDSDPLQEDGEESLSWLDNRMQYEEDLSGVEYEILVSRIKAHLNTPVSRSNGVDLALFFDFVVIQMKDNGAVDVQELTDLYGVTRTTIYNYLHKLRAQVSEVMES